MGPCPVRPAVVVHDVLVRIEGVEIMDGARMATGRGAVHRLGSELRRLRQQARLSGRALADQIGWSAARVSRIENAEEATTVEDVETLLEHLRLPVRRRREILMLAREANEAAAPGRPPRARPERARSQLNTLVRGAAAVRHFQPTAVPGLLQTPEYARAALELADLDRRHDLDAAVSAQLALQRVLTEPDCPRYHFLLGEVGLRCLPDEVGPEETSDADPDRAGRDQLERIIGVAARKPVTVQVLRTGASNAALGRHGFRLYDFDDPDEPAVAYLDLIGTEMVVHDEENVGVFVATWQRLQSSALSPKESLSFLRSLIRTP